MKLSTEDTIELILGAIVVIGGALLVVFQFWKPFIKRP